jgi:hypothetical protein
MNRSISILACLTALMSVLVCSEGFAQEAAAPAAKPAAEKAGDKATPKQPTVTTKSPYRKLAPGVMISIDTMRELKESVDRHDIVELLAVDSKYDWAKDIPIRRDVWVLDIKFKPVRMIYVDIPQPSGFMQRKLIWYMVYSVTNTGKILHPVEGEDLPYETTERKQLYKVEMVDKAVRFAPEFLIEAHVRRPDQSILTKAYPDRVIPVAMGPIQTREDPNRKFLTSVDMTGEIAVGETKWGVATWEDIDPKTFQFSVYVTGLTNSYRWTDVKEGPEAYKQGDPIGKGRKMQRKILKLNFWRAGDQYFEHEEEIRYGVPGKVDDFEWVYR